jgi:hypothetical protein
VKRESDLAARLERGEYVIDAHGVAEAMLRRRGPGLLMLVPGELERPAVDGPEDDPDPDLNAA